MTRDEIIDQLRALDRVDVEEMLYNLHDESELDGPRGRSETYHKIYLLLSMLINDQGQKVWDEEYGNE